MLSESGSAEILPITGYDEGGSVDKIASLIERSPDILARLRDVFTKKKKDAKDQQENGIEVDDAKEEN